MNEFVIFYIIHDNYEECLPKNDSNLLLATYHFKKNITY